MFRLIETPEKCKKGHPLSPDNIGVHGTRGTWFCRTCKRDGDRRSKKAAKERAALATMLAPAPDLRPAITTPISPQLAAWVARKRRERAGLPLRRCDREQVSEQMEDLGTL